MNIKKWLEQRQDGEKVLVTGASSGIGLEYLKILTQLKCDCIAVSNEKDSLERVAKELSNQHQTNVTPIVCDLSVYKNVEDLIEKLSSHQILGLINNAGFGLKGAFTSIGRDTYHDIIGVNLMAPTMLTHALLPAMRDKNRGFVIQVASINVVSPIPKNSVYTATKSYLFNLAMAVGKENEDSDILFQTLLPGTTATPFHEKQGARPSALTMSPAVVARRSLDHLDSKIFIPNRADRWLYPFFIHLPLETRMRIAAYSLKKRLGI